MVTKDWELVPQEQDNHQTIKVSALGTHSNPRGWSASPCVAANEKENKNT